MRVIEKLIIWVAVLVAFVAIPIACAQEQQSESIDTMTLCLARAESMYQVEYSRIMDAMHREMMNATTPGADDQVNFLKQMIPHHQGAIDMSESILKYTKDRRIVNIAKGIITEQRNEIIIMEHLIADLESDSLPSSKSK
jgi:uncharacterized protein (DUF305 family)